MELLLTVTAEEVELIFDELLILNNNLTGRKLDMRNYKRIDTKANYNVNISGQDKSGIARKKLAIKRSTKRQSKASSSTKRQNKSPSSQINKKQRISKIIDESYLSRDGTFYLTSSDNPNMI
ncbi:11650_t:CDS:2 [Dentiscutata heterogama]|uniref:11650_t:CDS:1 n=1 Tax=Dentiscutata heterogama TaxID=1316150 RepID=A0ACA9M0H5_9GLOM|nr:11650_t:CDS:2 [Dentiscutata heterogama]